MNSMQRFTLVTVLALATACASWAAEETAYPLTTCVVSGEKLGAHGKPYVHTHEGREIQFCCKSCLKDFNRDPAPYLQKLDEAKAAAQAPAADTPPPADAHKHSEHDASHGDH